MTTSGWRALFLAFVVVWWLAVIGLFALQSSQYHGAIRHSDHNRCLQSQRVWDVGVRITQAVTEPNVIPPDQLADAALAERLALTNEHRALERRAIFQQIGPRPTC